MESRFKDWQHLDLDQPFTVVGVAERFYFCRVEGIVLAVIVNFCLFVVDDRGVVAAVADEFVNLMVVYLEVSTHNKVVFLAFHTLVPN